MAGDVTVITDQAHYAPGATMRVTITNQSVAAVRVADHQSDCTAARLERWDGQAWELQHPCRLMRPTRLLALAPGAALTEVVRPPAEGGTSGWPPGRYRATCAYLAGPDGAEVAAHSAPFAVG